MGKIITTWSPYHGQCKTTAATAALANTTKNTVVTHIQPKMSNMENMFGLMDILDKGLGNDVGFNNLIYTTMGKKITQNDVDNAVIRLTSDLCILPSIGQNKNDETQNILIKHILTEILPQYYQYVFIDLGTETSELAMEIQEKAYANYIVLSQNKVLWKKYNQTERDRYVLSGYDNKSKFNKRTFQMNVSGKVDVIPYCIEYADAISAGEVKEFFLRNENILENPGANNELTNFFRELRRVKI